MFLGTEGGKEEFRDMGEWSRIFNDWAQLQHTCLQTGISAYPKREYFCKFDNNFKHIQ